MKTSTPAPWLQHVPAVDGDGDAHVIVYPHAGGGPRFYRDLCRTLAQYMNVWVAHYPGREQRIADPLPESLVALADALTEHIDAHVPRPFRMFGHSMGATVALECARRLPERTELLVVSASPAPHARDPRNVHSLAEDEFITEIQSMGATPEGVLSHPELRALVIPVLRHDFRLVETHEVARETIDTPIIAYAGRDDHTVTVDTIARWSECTTSSFSLRTFAGDHFYLQTATDDLVDALRADLLGAPTRGGHGRA